jgi:hypothetical protein
MSEEKETENSSDVTKRGIDKNHTTDTKSIFQPLFLQRIKRFFKTGSA